MHNAYSLDKKYYELITNLVANNPHQLSVGEYLLIAKLVSFRSPCNFLVFGVGRDSFLWMQLNKGKTIFLEDNPHWLELAKKQNPNIKAYLIKYNTYLNQWKELLHQPKLLELDLPNEIKKTKWDIIFVDAPAGYTGSSPGRMKSIYNTYLLSLKNSQIDIFVHDCNRNVEKIYSDKYLSQYTMVIQLGKLRYYRKNYKQNKVN